MLPIAPGVSAEMPLCRDGLGLLLAEIRQERGDLQEAIDAVEVLEPTTYAAVSLAELYSQVGRHADVIELTEGLANEDDASALLLVYRGIALRAEGIPDAALEALNLALRARSRDKAIRLFAYSERASVYVELGRKAMARKDLGRILAEDSTYEGVQQRLEELQ
jgi:tetratricopeptide (TPR) repeat protein